MKKRIKQGVAWLIVLVIWQLLSMAIDQKYDADIILPPPIKVFKQLFAVVSSNEFFKTLLFSLGRIVLGFLAGVAFGTVLGIVSGKWENIEILIKPIITVIKTVPVASFVILVLIWANSEKLSIIIAFLMVLPVIYTNVLQGVKSIDVKMLQMASVYQMTFWGRLKYLWLPSVKPFFMSGSTVAAGLAWKSGIAAELIGVPDGSIGGMLYDSKTYFDTSTLLAWTIVIVAASVATEKIFVLVMKQLWKLAELTPSPKGKRALSTNGENSTVNRDENTTIREGKILISLHDVSKSYGEENVISGFSHEFDGGVTAISGKSGGGKTTLLNMILGIEKADRGSVSVGSSKISVVFQEDRLSETFTPVANVASVVGEIASRTEIENLLCRLGLRDSLDKQVSKLSGGMKRRTAIARALLYNGDILIMDEPFKGLDEGTKDEVIKIVKEYSVGKTVIFVTHDEEEISAMGAKKFLKIDESGFMYSETDGEK